MCDARNVRDALLFRLGLWNVLNSKPICMQLNYIPLLPIQSLSSRFLRFNVERNRTNLFNPATVNITYNM